VAAPERLVFTISDQPDDDRYELVTVVLTDLGDGRTPRRASPANRRRPESSGSSRVGRLHQPHGQQRGPRAFVERRRSEVALAPAALALLAERERLSVGGQTTARDETRKRWALDVNLCTAYARPVTSAAVMNRQRRSPPREDGSHGVRGRLCP
jgi:hypothetical protein